MWGKILATGKKFLGAKAKELAIKKGTEAAEESGILSKIGQIPMLIGCTGISGLALLLITPLIIFVGSFGTIFIMQGVDPYFASASTGGTGSAAAGEAASIQGEDARIEWLYDGNGVPQTEEENEKYLATNEFSYLNVNGSMSTINLTLHKKLINEVQAIFDDLAEIKFGLEWESGGGSIRGWGTDSGYSGKFYHSSHCYGHTLDINVAANPCPQCGVGSESDYAPGVNPQSVTPQVVEIFKKHGFFWGGDWTSPKDYMHFSYFDH